MRSRMRGRLALLGAAAFLSAAVLVPSAGAVTLTGSITSTDASHTSVQFPFVASSCATPNASLVVASAPLHYDTYTLFNQGASASCVTVTYTASSDVFIAAYSPSFNPADLAQNFLGSTVGQSGCGGTSGSFSFTVPANSSFVVEAEECNPGGVASYSLDVTGTGVALAARFRSLSARSTARGTLLRWRTASQFELAGFNVYRAINGHRVRVNKHLIAARNGASGASYRYLDRSAGKAARYWIQAVNLDGSFSWFGPARVAT